MDSIAQKPYRFNQEADACLDELYKSVGATLPAHKITLLQKELGSDFKFQAFGGQLNDEIRLGCLEYEYLERLGKIQVILA